MSNIAKEFCTCQNKECPMNPVNHDDGCDLCIRVNLSEKSIPRCFFHKAMGEDISPVETWSFEEFANMVKNGR